MPRRRLAHRAVLGCCVLLASVSLAEAHHATAGSPPTAEELGRAIQLGSEARVRFLLAAGADPNAVDPIGFSMVDMAILGGEADILEALLAAGADVEAEGLTRERPLVTAVRSGDTSIVRVLLSAGASVGASDEFGDTALKLAVTAGDVEIVRVLVEAGASPYAVDYLGYTVLEHARDGGDPTILALLDDRPEASTQARCERSGGAADSEAGSARPRLATQVGHGDEPVVAAALSADGRIALTGGWDNIARVWHAATSRELRALYGHSGWVETVSLSADGGLALTGSRDGSAILWDTRSGRLLLRLDLAERESTDRVVAVALSADGLVALTATRESAVVLWDVASCDPLRSLKAPGRISAAVFSPDFRLVAAGTEEGDVVLWEAATGKLLETWPAHDGAVSSVTVSLDGEHLLSTSGSLGSGSLGDEMAFLWELGSKRIVQRFGPHAQPGINGLHSAAFIGDGVVLTSDSEGLYLWDVATGEKTAEATDILLGFTSAAVAPGARCVLAGTLDMALFVDVEKAEACGPILDGATYPVMSLRPAADDGALLAAAGFAVAWDFAGSRESRRLELADEIVTSADWSGTRVATGGGLGPARLWDLPSGLELRQIQRPGTVFSRVAFSPDGEILLTAGGELFASNEDLEIIEQDYSLFLWYRRGKAVVRLANEDHPVASMAFTPDGSHVYATGFSDVRAWSVPSGKPLGTVDHGPPALPVALAVQPGDGGRLAIGMDAWGRIGDPLRIVDLTGDGTLLSLPGSASAMRAVTFSRDGRVVYGGSDDGVVRTYDSNTGRRLGELSHGAPVTAIAPVGDDRLASGAVDGSIVLWDREGGSEIVRLFSFAGGAWLVVDPEGRFDTNDFDELDGAHWLLPEDPLTPLPLEIFTRQYFVPRLLARSLEGEDLGETAPIRDLPDLNLAQPEVEIVAVEMPDADSSLATVTVRVGEGQRERKAPHPAAEDRTDVYDLRLFRDGQLVAVAPAEEPGSASSPGETLEEWRSRSKLSLVDGEATLDLPVRLPRGRTREVGETVEISAYAFNEDRIKSETARTTLELPDAPRSRPGRAYVVVIGVGDNASYAWKLYTAGNDARLAARELSRVLGGTGRFDRVVTVPLVSHLEGPLDEGGACREMQPTKERIRAVFARLAGAPAAAPDVDVPCAAELETAGPDDAVWIVYSGHGYARRDGSFYLLPYDMDGIHGTNLTERGLPRAISSDELSEWLRPVDAGELFLAIDACQAAAIVEGGGFRPGPLGDSGFGQLAYDKRMTVISATQSNALAVGRGGAVGGHGLLTYSLFEEGLARGLADRRPRDGRLTLGEWLDYSIARVPELFLEADGATGTPQQPSLYDFSRSSDRSWELSR